MKKLVSLFSFILLIIASSTAQDAIEKYFSHFLEDDDFKTVYVSPKMFEMVSGVDIKDMDPELQEMIKQLRGLRIVQTDKKGLAHFNEVNNTIDKKDYDSLMEVRDNDEQVRFYIKDEGDIINELVLLVGSDSQFVLMSFVGNISLDQISKLASKMQFSGAKHLEKLNNR